MPKPGTKPKVRMKAKVHKRGKEKSILVFFFPPKLVLNKSFIMSCVCLSRLHGQAFIYPGVIPGQAGSMALTLRT